MKQRHKCSVCKKNYVKLYRYYSNFLRDDEIYCRGHSPEGLIESESLVPLIERKGGVWGFGSVPHDAVKLWNTLPD